MKKLGASGLVFLLAGCGAGAPASSPQKPVVQSLKIRPAGERESIAQAVAASGQTAQATAPAPVIEVSATVNKDALLSQEFLYGADLQYSSFYDAGMDLYNQSLAIGHVPARFRIAGNELQLVADNRRLFPSDVNHPEQLLSRFTIQSRTETTLTISGANSRVFLAEAFEGTHTDTKGGLVNPAGQPPRDSWIRSFEYVPRGNYLLQETSVILADGTLAEFMESIFPRATLAPGANFGKFEMNPLDPVGGSEGPVARFRLLPGEKIFDGEKTLAFAQHFDISPDAQGQPGTIDWYVTPNIPDEDLQPVQLAVEGWNRYFTRYKKISRKVVRFMGRLPQGVKLGDPRYNVINWDSRLIAGAAYETQATDPQSGKQSHSLIYMPAAWLRIGTDYWKNGESSDSGKFESVSPQALEAHGGATRTARLACLRDTNDAAALLASGRLSADEVADFGKRLLKGTLFHEVGHALGLAHNFKGSLTFDRSKPGSMFSSSIMDYNDYEIERAAFPALASSDGPALEYDRQALSALYDQGADISESDPVMPTCNDAEADTEANGVDPLCNRYDIENDPTLSVVTALNRVNQATLAGDVSLAQALERVPELALGAETLKNIKSTDDLQAALVKLATAVRGSLRFYFTDGKASLAKTTRLNVKSLLVFEEGVLPAGYSEQAMRERAFAGVQAVLAMSDLSAAVKDGLKKAEAKTTALLATTPFYGTLSDGDRAKASQLAANVIEKTAASFVKADGLPTLRSTILLAIARHKEVPFYFGTPKGASAAVDYETAIVGILSDTALDAKRSARERAAAATALTTYSGRRQGDEAIAAAATKLEAESAAAANNEARELAEGLLGVLKGAK